MDKVINLKNNMNKKNIISILLLIIFIIIAIFFIKNNLLNIIKIFNNINYNYIIILFIVNLFIIFVNAFIHKYLFLFYNLKLPFQNYFPLIVVASFLNLITPFRGGLIYKTLYLKKKYNFSITNSFEMNIFIYLCSFLLISLVNIFTLLYLHIYNKILFFYIIFFITIILITSFLFYYKQIINKIVKSNKLKKILPDIDIKIYIKNYNIKKLYVLLLLNFSSFILICSQIFFSYKSINITLSLDKIVFLSGIMVLSLFVSLTPGNLGIQESIFIFSSKVIKINSIYSFMSSIIIRLTFSSLLLILFIISYFYLHIHNKNTN